jgi:hypothetical protein
MRKSVKSQPKTRKVSSKSVKSQPKTRKVSSKSVKSQPKTRKVTPRKKIAKKNNNGFGNVFSFLDGFCETDAISVEKDNALFHAIEQRYNEIVARFNQLQESHKDLVELTKKNQAYDLMNQYNTEITIELERLRLEIVELCKIENSKRPRTTRFCNDTSIYLYNLIGSFINEVAKYSKTLPNESIASFGKKIRKSRFGNHITLGSIRGNITQSYDELKNTTNPIKTLGDVLERNDKLVNSIDGYVIPVTSNKEKGVINYGEIIKMITLSERLRGINMLISFITNKQCAFNLESDITDKFKSLIDEIDVMEDNYL